MSDKDDDTEDSKMTPEQRAKFQAEADKVRDDNRRAEELHNLAVARAGAEVRELEIKAKKALVDLETAEHTAHLQYITLNQTVRQEEASLASDLFHHVYHFTSEVSDRSVDECIGRLSYWHRTAPGVDFEIIFSSPGGSVFAGMKLFDFIQEIKRGGHKVTTHTLGMAASMAGILLQAGSTRTMGKEALILIHEISTVAWGSASQLEDEVLLIKRMQKRATDIFMAGIDKAKKAGTASEPMTRAKFEKEWKRKDWWVTSDDAVKYGFVDEVR